MQNERRRRRPERRRKRTGRRKTRRRRKRTGRRKTGRKKTGRRKTGRKRGAVRHCPDRQLVRCENVWESPSDRATESPGATWSDSLYLFCITHDNHSYSWESLSHIYMSGSA